MSKKQFVVSGLALAAFAALAATYALAAPITDFILYGVNGVVIGNGSEVNGLVGAENDNVGTSVAIKLQGNSDINGDARSGGDVNLQNNAHITGTIFHLTGTTLTMGSGSTVGSDQTGNAAFVMLPGLPAATSFTCPTGGANYSGANNQSLTLNPGTYGTIQFGSQFELTLDGSGDYYFDSITAGNGAKLTVKQSPGLAPVRIFVCGAVNFTGSVTVSFPNNPSPSNPDLVVEVHAAGANAFRAAGGSNWTGDVFAPYGQIHLGGGGCCSFFTGRFWGDEIDVEHSAFIDADIPGQNPGPLPSKDATLLHGLKNINNGGNLSLRVGSQIAALVGFDVSGLNFSSVTDAKLVLTVCHTPGDPTFCPDPPSGWPAAGGNVFAYRLNDGFENWAEGNGNNFPIVNNPHGNGPGVTWNCMTDTEVANEKRECILPNWGNNGGQSAQGPARGPVLHFNLPTFTDGTQVMFDVTPDVQAGLGPTDTTFMSWFIRKPSGGGTVYYYSREGALAAGNPAFAPQLVITP